MGDSMKLSPMVRRIRAFIIANGTSIIAILPAVSLLSRKFSFSKQFIIKWWTATCFRLGFICAVLGMLTRRRLKNDESDLHKSRIKEPSQIEMIIRLLFVAGPLEAGMTSVALKRFCSPTTTWWKFIPMTFIFEILLDFGHYLSHRLMHSHSWLYQVSGHKTHHAIHKPTVLATFCQAPIDVFLSNIVPVMSSLWIMDRAFNMKFTKEQLLLAFSLKTYVEVAGHVGILDGNTTSFPQCVWLPRLFGIELHTRDHDLHHTHGGRHNFAKRFTLFDKLFNTYRTLDRD